LFCSFGPRFPPLGDAYDKSLRNIFKECAKELKLEQYLREGVYCNVAGPSYETIAELKLLQSLGGDTVGEYNCVVNGNSAFCDQIIKEVI